MLFYEYIPHYCFSLVVQRKLGVYFLHAFKTLFRAKRRWVPP